MTKEQKCISILDLWDMEAVIGLTPIILTNRFTIQTLHILKDEYKTKCNQDVINRLGQTCFQNADLQLKSKKCKRCYHA